MFIDKNSLKGDNPNCSYVISTEKLSRNGVLEIRSCTTSFFVRAAPHDLFGLLFGELA